MKGFVNPYNFIKFPSKKAKAYTDEDRHTGVIEYTITTKTPLFIPNSSSDSAFKISKKVNDHKSYDFFSYTELDPTKTYNGEYHVPVIPGSEIRGVVRNAYETLTNSCMGLLNADEYPVKRSVARFDPGLLYKDREGNFTLYEARSLRLGKDEPRPKKSEPKGFEDYPNGTIIYYKNPPKNEKHQFMPIEVYSMNGKYSKEGYLLKWGMGATKKRCHVFSIKKDNQNGGETGIKVEDIHLSKDDIERKLLRVIDYYLAEPGLTGKNKAAYEEYKQDVKNFLEGDGDAYFPVNYSKLDRGIYYLAPATLTKEVSDNNIGKLAGEFAPCEKDYCPTCELFGYVGKSNESSKGSKIRFTDLYVTQEKDAASYYMRDCVTIQALGEPKLGNTEFYLRQPTGATFWNYDYYVRNKKLQISDGILRGRKYYWHHQKMTIPEDIEATKLNKTIRPVKTNESFGGKLYFEDISKKQLKQLMWILNSGSDGLGLKLGGAKPLGFGSVSCKVNTVVERNITACGDKISYLMNEIPMEGISYEEVGFSETVKEEFYKITGLKSVPKDVEITYPKEKSQKGKPLTEGYKWFVNNHRPLSGARVPNKRTEAIINEVLPDILEEDFSMKYNGRDCVKNFEKKHDGKRENRGKENSGGTYQKKYPSKTRDRKR